MILQHHYEFHLNPGQIDRLECTGQFQLSLRVSCQYRSQSQRECID